MVSTRKCFVISPIGAEGSEVRRHADDVFDFIIKPAVDECGIFALRSDHLHEPGRISEQMFREILGSDCCIVVLTGYNPNVFYELAVAQCVGTPVVILIEKGQSLPFDIQDLRCVNYDFSPRPLFEKTYSQKVAQHLRSLEALSWQAPPLFGELSFLRPGRSGLPKSLMDELQTPLDAKREALSNQQKRILFHIESLCRTQELVSQHDIAASFGKPHDDTEVYYRLEHLRLLGLIEKHRDPSNYYFSYKITYNLD
jgi:hypothetical protein